MIMPSEKMCCIPDCSDFQTVRHRFPNPAKDMKRFMTWVFNIGGEILALSNEYIYNNRRVCHAHFETKYCCRFNRISNIAVPTLNIPDQICSVQLAEYKQYDDVRESSSEEQNKIKNPTSTIMKNSPQISGDLAEHFESEALIHRVYNYLQTEYKLLQSLNENTDCDLSPLSNILQRTAEAIGITPQMVSDVLNKENLIKRHSLQRIMSRDNCYIDNSIREGENTATEETTEDYIPDFKRRKHNTEEIRITGENTEDYIPDFKPIEDNSEEFIIKEENIDDYNTNFLRGEHNTEEIRMARENTEDYIPDVKIIERNSEEFIIKDENTEVLDDPLTLNMTSPNKNAVSGPSHEQPKGRLLPTSGCLRPSIPASTLRLSSHQFLTQEQDVAACEDSKEDEDWNVFNQDQESLSDSAMAESSNSKIATSNNVCVTENQATSDLPSIICGYPKTAAERMREYRARKKKENPTVNHLKSKKSCAERVREYRARNKAKIQLANSTMAESTNIEESSNALIVKVNGRHRQCLQLSASISTTNNVCVIENQATSDLPSIGCRYPKTAAERMRQYRVRKKEIKPYSESFKT